jgi:hypothetical protein
MVPPLSNPCECVSIRGEKSSQKETMLRDSTAKNFRIGLLSQPATKKRFGFPEVFSGSDLCAFAPLR